MTSQSKKEIALIGAGHWGKNHLKNLYELGVLHSVVERSQDILEQRQKDYPDIPYFLNDSEILANPEIKAVVIAVPASLHYSLTKKFLLAGKDVLVEKPLALNSVDGSDLVATAKKHQRILMVGHILQYHPAVIRLKELIDQGELGEIQYIYSNRLNIGKLRVEENVLWSFAPHDISLILMLLKNQEPHKISAKGGAYIHPHIFDTTLTFLDFDNGVKCHIFVSWLHPFKEQKLVVVGDKKMAVFDDVSDKKLSIYPHKIDFSQGNIPVAQKAESIQIDFPSLEPLHEELCHFLLCIRNREQPLTDGQEGLRVLKILEKAQQSLLSNISSLEK